MISWARGASRLVISLARDGVLPRPLATLDAHSRTPRRALAALGLLEGVGLASYALTGSHLDVFLRLGSANFVATYVIIFLAAWRLLDLRRFGALLVIASAGIVVLSVASSQSLGYILASVGLYGALLLLRPWFARRWPPRRWPPHAP
ncbi:MAG: hypothetical protein ABI068_04520 [Ktedonobacterales bacterium]